LNLNLKIQVIGKKTLLLAAVALISIIFVLFFFSKNFIPTSSDLILGELKSIAAKNSQANQMLQDSSVQVNYEKLTGDQIKNFVDSGQIPSASSEIYMVDLISSKTNSGITLIIDLENKNILKSQTVVGVSVG
jgi:hypothetical protein